MPVSTDTIVAPATPAGTAALAIVRASGPDCAKLALSALGQPGLVPRVATHRDYVDRTGRLVDDVVAIFYVGPNSYTGEDLLEISAHGNPFIVQQLVEDAVARGCRVAEPGEFTRRAFLNGRLDLAQAEAVMDVVHARGEQALAAAQQQLRGSLGRHLESLTSELIGIVARVEAYIDFPEEDLPEEDREACAVGTAAVLRGTDRLLATKRYGDVLREGLRTVLLGETNAGKSTLLNALLGEERALVSPEPGTTRDYLEERILVGRHTLRIVDTAGLNPAPGALERRGIEKTFEQLEKADLVILVLDATAPLPRLTPEVLGRLKDRPVIVAANKWDAVPEAAPVPAFEGTGWPIVTLSALQRTGLEELTRSLEAVATRYQPAGLEDLIAINARHAGALQEAQRALHEVLRQLKANEPAELVAANLRSALSALGEIVGPIDHERVLDRLFLEFCIGK